MENRAPLKIVAMATLAFFIVVILLKQFIEPYYALNVAYTVLAAMTSFFYGLLLMKECVNRGNEYTASSYFTIFWVSFFMMILSFAKIT